MVLGYHHGYLQIILNMLTLPWVEFVLLLYLI